ALHHPTAPLLPSPRLFRPVRIARRGGPPLSLGESAASDPAAPPGFEKLAGRRTICGIHSRAASTAGIAQIPSAQRQDTPTTAITDRKSTRLNSSHVSISSA